ncbi:hypothetical protein [Priestia megaterium]
MGLSMGANGTVNTVRKIKEKEGQAGNGDALMTLMQTWRLWNV